jgi:hypothetical protein
MESEAKIPIRLRLGKELFSAGNFRELYSAKTNPIDQLEYYSPGNLGYNLASFSLSIVYLQALHTNGPSN